MKPIYFISVFILLVSHILQSQSEKSIPLKTEDYKLNIDVDFNKEKIIADCKITINNPTNEKTKVIPLLLYRLLKVRSITDENGKNIKFTQQIRSFEDEELLQVNVIKCFLDKPLIKNKPKTICIKYSGYLKGYAETGSTYLHDEINSDFTIFREDCYAYPIVGYPNDKINRIFGFQSYDYLIKVKVPDTLTVANGGKLIQIEEKNNYVTYTYKNIKPAWRMDIAISDYDVSERNGIKIFNFKEDILGAKYLSKAAIQAYELYTDWWGELHNFKGFSIIEIPDNWGSQTDVSCIIQSASSFRDTTNFIEIYHELSHFWNIKSNDSFDPRWNEGLAMFLQYLTEEKLSSARRLELATDWSLKRIKTNKSFETCPPILFGENDLTDLSYKMGIAMFKVLHDLMGEEDFNLLIKTYYQKYHRTGATTEEFIQTANNISNINLDSFFKDWMYTTRFVTLVKKGTIINDFIKLYK